MHVELEFRDGSDPVLELEGEEFPIEGEGQCLIRAARAADAPASACTPGAEWRRVREALPLGRELVAQTEGAHQTQCAVRLYEAVERRGELARGLLLEQLAAVAGRVAQVQDDVGDRVVVELAELGRQLEPPGADRARALERQVALVAQVGLEQAAVVLAAAGDDRLDRAEAVGEAGVVVALARVLARRAACSTCGSSSGAA